MAFADTRPKPPPFGRRPHPSAAKPAATHAMPTVMIMAYDWGTGAHAVVSDRLSQALQRKGCKVVIFTDEQTKARMNWQSDAENNFTVIATLRAYIPQLNAFEDAFNQHKPDVVVTEHYPMNNRGSDMSFILEDCIKFAQKTSTHAQRPLQVHALVRDIPDVKDLSKLNDVRLFDHFLIRGDEKIHSYAKHFADDPTWQKIEANNKVHYVGYAADKPLPKAEPPAKNNSVVVSLGGGVISGDSSLYKNIILAAKTLPSEPKYDSLRAKQWHIYAPEELCESLKKEAKNAAVNIEIHPFSRNFADAMQCADMVVCRAGMTAIESVAQGLPTLIIPRQYEYHGEQKTRAAALQHKASHLVVSVDEKSIVIPSDLSEPLKQTLAKSASSHINHAPPFTLNGHENAADAIIAAFQGKSIDSADKAWGTAR